MTAMSTQPPRCAVVHTPAWPLVAAVMNGLAARGPEYAPDQPLAIMRSQRVLCCSPVAWRDGVRPGMRRRQAQGACPHVVLVADDPDRDARCFEPVVRSVGELVPLLDIESPGSLLMATRGPSRYVGGDAALTMRLTDLAMSGLSAAVASRIDPATLLSVGGGLGVGVADGRLAATLAARWAIRRGEPVVVEPGSAATAAFLAPHPVSALGAVAGCDVGLVDLLQRLGLRRFGDVAALSPHHLVDRFGALGHTVHRLVSGTDDSAPSALPPPPDLTIVRLFDDPVTQFDMLVFAAKSLVDELGRYFAERGQVCTRVRVEAETEHGETSVRVWHRAEGMNESAMVDRVRWQLDGWINGADPPSAGVTKIALIPLEIRGDAGTQEGFWGGRTAADDAAARAITRVMALVGPAGVTVASWRGGRDPREQYRMVSVADVGADGTTVHARPTDSTAPRWPGAIPTPSPALVHHQPVGVRVLDVDGHAVSVSGRGFVSSAPTVLCREHGHASVTAWAGPWPVEERWWDERARRVARFQLVVQTSDGPRAYLAEVSSGQWWLVAEYA
jgi:protein ImuB